MAGYSHQENLDDASDMARMFLTLDRLPVPVIGRVQGAALGGGAGLAAICDIVVAADDAVFGFTEVRLGLIPAVIAPFVLGKIGRSAARELFLTGARFSAERAKSTRAGARRRARGRARRRRGRVRDGSARRRAGRHQPRPSISSRSAPSDRRPKRRRCAPKPSPRVARRRRARKGFARSSRRGRRSGETLRPLQRQSRRREGAKAR